jgi:hypothetical protein
MAKDESYVLDLCDKVLNSVGSRQRTFDFLVGDCGKDGRCRRLPVDAYYREHNLVVEYRERQHTEPVAIMDRHQTISCCSRGEQRRRYDERRREVLAQNAVALVEFDYKMFSHNSRKRLDRISLADEAMIGAKLAGFLKAQNPEHPSKTAGRLLFVNYTIATFLLLFASKQPTFKPIFSSGPGSPAWPYAQTTFLGWSVCSRRILKVIEIRFHPRFPFIRCQDFA